MGINGALGPSKIRCMVAACLNKFIQKILRDLATADSFFGIIFGYLGRSRNSLQLNYCLTTDRYLHGKAGKAAACMQLSPLFILEERKR